MAKAKVSTLTMMDTTKGKLTCDHEDGMEIPLLLSISRLQSPPGEREPLLILKGEVRGGGCSFLEGDFNDPQKSENIVNHHCIG